MEAISLGRSGLSAGFGFGDRLVGSSRRVSVSVMEKIIIRVVRARMIKEISWPQNLGNLFFYMRVLILFGRLRYEHK